MSIAAIGTTLEVVNLVATYGPKLMNDATALATLYFKASGAVASSAPDGTIAPADWAALNASVAGLRSELDAEVAADAAASSAAMPASTVPGAG